MRGEVFETVHVWKYLYFTFTFDWLFEYGILVIFLRKCESEVPLSFSFSVDPEKPHAVMNSDLCIYKFWFYPLQALDILFEI